MSLTALGHSVQRSIMSSLNKRSYLGAVQQSVAGRHKRKAEEAVSAPEPEAVAAASDAMATLCRRRRSTVTRCRCTVMVNRRERGGTCECVRV